MNEEPSSSPAAESADLVGAATDQASEWVQRLYDFAVNYGANVVGAILTLVIGYLVARFLARRAERLALRSKNPDPSLAAIARKTVFAILMLVVLVAVLERFGVETTSFIAVLGAAGLAIGLALQGTLSNIASGVMLLTLRPFKAGDAVSIGGGNPYIIDEVGLFVTRAHQFDCPRAIIPNSRIWGNEIVNYTQTQDGLRRFDIVFGISYSDNISEALEILRKIADEDPRVKADPEPLAKVESLGDSSVNLLLRVYTDAAEWLGAKLDLTQAGKEALEAGGKTIPFPQRDVHISKEDAS